MFNFIAIFSKLALVRVIFEEGGQNSTGIVKVGERAEEGERHEKRESDDDRMEAAEAHPKIATNGS